MIVVLAEEAMIPGQRAELVAAHDRVTPLLAEVPGFVAARLLHFAGGGYRYVFEMEFRTRDDWETFFASPVFATLHESIDPCLTVPFGVQVHTVVSR